MALADSGLDRIVTTRRYYAAAQHEQLDALTALRFFAAMHVVLHHYTASFFAGQAQSHFIELGYTGVTFFFVLSGFILTHNYHRIDFSDPVQKRRYFVARIARIVPVFLLSLLIAAPFYLLQASKMSPGLGRGLFLAGGIFAPLGLHAWVPGAACSINCPSWSISTELFFYLMFPLLMAPIIKWPRIALVLICGFWLASLSIYGNLWQTFGHGAQLMAPGDPLVAQLAAQFIKFWPLGRLAEFMLGIAVYGLWQRLANRPRVSHTVALAAFFALLLTLSPHASGIALHNGLTAIIFVPLIFAAARTTAGPLRHPALVFLGQISFSLYLLHEPLLSVLKAVDKRALGSALLNSPRIGMLIAIGVSVLVSAVVFSAIEEPCRRYIKARAARQMA